MGSTYQSWTTPALLEEIKRLKKLRRDSSSTFSDALTDQKLRSIAQVLEKRR